jgi:hypothetical protein
MFCNAARLAWLPETNLTLPLLVFFLVKGLLSPVVQSLTYFPRIQLTINHINNKASFMMKYVMKIIESLLLICFIIVK